MNQSKSPVAWLAYLIVGIVLLLLAVQVLRGVLYLVYWIATVILSAALVLALAWIIYALVKSAWRSQQ